MISCPVIIICSVLSCSILEQRSLRELREDKERCAYFNSLNAKLETGKYDDMM